MTQTLEKVSFRTSTKIEEQAFLAEAQKVTAWAASQSGFQYRTLVKEGDDWIDLIFWASEENAKSAGQAFMNAPETKAFAAMIDPDSVSMAHLPQLHSSCTGAM